MHSRESKAKDRLRISSMAGDVPVRDRSASVVFFLHAMVVVENMIGSSMYASDTRHVRWDGRIFSMPLPFFYPRSTCFRSITRGQL